MFTFRWKPPTFTRLDSAAHLRGWFPHNPTRSLRDPERHQGPRSFPSALQMNLMQPLGRQIAVLCLGTPIGAVRCLVDSGHHSGLCRILRDRGMVSRWLTPTSFGLTIACLSQARRLGGLPRASPGPLSGRLALTRQEHPWWDRVPIRLAGCLEQPAAFSTHSNHAPRGARHSPFFPDACRWHDCGGAVFRSATALDVCHDFAIC
jgi:hypothetical protein